MAYHKRIAWDQIYIWGAHDLVLSRYVEPPFIFRLCHGVEAPFTGMAAMERLDDIALASTGALPSELHN